jgi:hypothetical protein
MVDEWKYWKWMNDWSMRGWMLALTISKHKTICIQENYEIFVTQM